MALGGAVGAGLGSLYGISGPTLLLPAAAGSIVGARLKISKDAADIDKKLGFDNKVDALKLALAGTGAGAGLGYFADDIHDIFTDTKDDLNYPDSIKIRNALSGAGALGGAGLLYNAFQKSGDNSTYFELRNDFRKKELIEKDIKEKLKNKNLSAKERKRLENILYYNEYLRQRNAPLINPFNYSKKEESMRNRIRAAATLTGAAAGAGLTYINPNPALYLKIPLTAIGAGTLATAAYDRMKKINYDKKEKELLSYLYDHPEERRKFYKELEKIYNYPK